MVVLVQDSCTGMSWLGRFDRQMQEFTAWVSAEQDRVAASLNGNTLVWGNGSGNRGSDMYRWQLNSDTVEWLGALEGYSLPFSGGDDAVAIPHFTTDGGAPLVAWDWFQTQEFSAM